MPSTIQRNVLGVFLACASLLASSCATTYSKELVVPGTYQEFVIDDLLVSRSHLSRGAVAHNVGQSFYMQASPGSSVRVFDDHNLLARFYAEEPAEIEISPTGEVLKDGDLQAEGATRVVIEEPAVYREVEDRAELNLSFLFDCFFDALLDDDDDDDYFDSGDDGSSVEAKPVPASKSRTRTKR